MLDVQSLLVKHQKLAVLVLLCVQNAVHSLVMGYSNGVLKEKYNKKTAVLMMELSKIVICVAMIVNAAGSVARGLDRVRALSLNPVPWLMAVPGLLYFIQNTLGFMALSHISAPLFSVLSQLKILTTALLSYIILGRVLSYRKVRALILLVVGVVLVQLTCDEDDNAGQNSVTGVVYVLMMVTTSGIAAAVMEKLMKSGELTLWEQNYQLAMWGVVSGAGALLWSDYAEVSEKGFFHGWTKWAVFSTLWGALGGLLVGAVVKLADSIVKGFATSIAIIMTALASWYYFDTQLNQFFVLGTVVVTVCVFNYSEPDAPAGPAAPASTPAAGTAAAATSSTSGAASGYVAGEVHRIEMGMMQTQAAGVASDPSRVGLLQLQPSAPPAGADHVVSLSAATDGILRAVTTSTASSAVPALGGKNE